MSTDITGIVDEIDATMASLVPAYENYRTQIKSTLFTAIATGIFGFENGGGAWTHRGTWNPLTEYEIGDVVDNDGSSYVAVTAHTGSEPPSADWELVAARGTDGGTGATGPAGPSNVITEAGGPTDLLVGAVADGEVLKRSGSTVVGVSTSTLQGGWPTGMFGDGSDGAIDLDGTNTYSFLTKVGSVYTMDRNVYATTLRVRNGCTLVKKYVLYVNDTLTVDSGGIVHDDGAAASGSTAGAGITAGSARMPDCVAGAGAAGRTTSGTGATATGTTTSYGGAGGAGGAANATAGGSGGTPSAPGASANSIRGMGYLSIFALVSAVTLTRANGAAGGGAGGCAPGTGTATSGGGGGGAPVSVLFARYITNGGVIRCNGGSGGNASVTGNGVAGGGGGGGGGYLIVVSNTPQASAGTVQANGGSGGTGAGVGGASGVDGSPGSVDYRGP